MLTRWKLATRFQRQVQAGDQKSKSRTCMKYLQMYEAMSPAPMMYPDTGIVKSSRINNLPRPCHRLPTTTATHQCLFIRATEQFNCKMTLILTSIDLDIWIWQVYDLKLWNSQLANLVISMKIPYWNRWIKTYSYSTIEV